MEPLPVDLKEMIEKGMGMLTKLPPHRRLFSPTSSPVMRGPCSEPQSEPESPVGAAAKHPKPPRGDIFAYTMPAKLSRPKKRRPMPKATAVVDTRATEDSEYTDPFTDWKKTVVDKNKMNLTQLKMQTDEGRAQLANHLKQEAKIFKKVDLPALDALSGDRLYENRTYFSRSGMYATEVGRRKEEAWNQKYRPPSKRESFRLEEEKELFKYYNVSLKRGSTEPTLKDLRRLLHSSYESSEVVKEQRRREAQDHMREEERRRRSKELEVAQERRQMLHGLRLGRQGEGMLSFGG